MTTKKRAENNLEKSILKGALAGLIAGFAASWVKSKVEPPLQKLGENLFPPTAEEKRMRGADITGHPLNMPPAILIEEVSEKVAGEKPDGKTTEAAMTVIHYAFGASLGATYGIVAEEIPQTTAVAGIPAGAIMWAATHGSTVPALGLQKSPEMMPVNWWSWEFGSHLVYGLTVELLRREIRKRL